MPKLGRWRSVVSPSFVKIYRPRSISRLRPTTSVLLAHCHGEFRGPRSDFVRQVAWATTATQRILIIENILEQLWFGEETQTPQVP
ncbi:hypothetical protein TNCV_600321 [Trichonephila clavipes]|nr:hypothetical protein TNCV_600321 [Trichonephila clavipes]